MRKLYTLLFGRALSAAFILTAGFAPNAGCGAWLMDEGHGQIITTVSTSNASDVYDRQGKASKGVDFSKLDSTIFAEHGLYENWTLGAKASLQQVSYASAELSLEYVELGPFQLWARRALWEGERSVVTGQITASYEGAFDSDTGVELSSGSFGYEARLLAGRSFELWERFGFIEGQIAYYEGRGQGVDEARLDFSAGYFISSDIEWITQIHGVKAVNTAQAALDYERLKMQSSVLLLREDGTRYQAGLFQTIAGSNSIKETGFVLGRHITY